MKIEETKHYSVQPDGQIVNMSDALKDTEEQCRYFAGLEENQVFDVHKNYQHIYFVKRNDVCNNRIKDTIKHILDDNNECKDIFVLDLTEEFMSPSGIYYIEDLSTEEIAVKVVGCKDCNRT